MKVWFDSDGRALCAQRGDMNAIGPEGSILVDVAGDRDINRIALVDGEVVDRLLMTIGRSTSNAFRRTPGRTIALFAKQGITRS